MYIYKDWDKVSVLCGDGILVIPSDVVTYSLMVTSIINVEGASLYTTPGQPHELTGLVDDEEECREC
jgi:hypothetical protein